MAIDTNFKTGIADAVTSLTTAEKVDFGNAIYTTIFEDSKFADKHTIVDGVRTGELIPIIERQNNYTSLSADKGDCSMNECDLDINFSTKKWTIGEYNCRIPICLKKYTTDFKLFFKMWNQTLDNPLEQPDKQTYFDFITEIAERDVNGALWRTGWWGDTTESLKPLISENNGIWTNADAGDGVKHTLPAGDLTGKQIYDELAAIYAKAINYAWFKPEEVQFKVTRKTAVTLVNWLNTQNDLSQYNCSCIDIDKVISARVFSVDNLAIFGIPVMSNHEIDESGNAVGVTPDFRILLINKNNVLVGVNTNDHLEQFKVFYDEKDNKVYIDMAIQIGTAIPLDEYIYATQTV